MMKPHELCYCQAARRNARFLSRMYDRHLAPAAINVQQYSILSVISERDGIHVAALAEEMVMERTTLLRALKPLQEAGLVGRVSGGKGRSVSLRITAPGKAKLLDANSLWRDAQREFEAKFGKGRAARLREEMKEAFATA